MPEKEKYKSHQENVSNSAEQRALYRMRELSAKYGNRFTLLLPESEDEEAYIRELAQRANYPEKMEISFEEREETEGIDPRSEDASLFHLAYQLRTECSVERLIVCGGVDDGKSTLIGRILYDAMPEEERECIYQEAKNLRSDGSVDFAMLAGGTEDEIRKGITIQVSYSSFSFGGKRYVLADVPGHEEYTHHMAMGANHSDVAVLMLAANKGIVPQTRRHSRICYFMGIRKMIFAVNKMDMVDGSRERFHQLQQEICQMMEEYTDCEIMVIPVAAKSGENIIRPSSFQGWYQGCTLLQAFDCMTNSKSMEASGAKEEVGVFSVQKITKSSQMAGAKIKKRILQGVQLCGSFAVGEEVTVFPNREKTKITGIYVSTRKQNHTKEHCLAGLEVDRELNVSRGCVIAKKELYCEHDRIEADLLWVGENSMQKGSRFVAQIGTKEVTAVVTKIHFVVDVNTGEHASAEYLIKHSLARCSVSFSEAVLLSSVKEDMFFGRFFLFDREHGYRVAYGNIVRTISEESLLEKTKEILPREREFSMGQKAGVILFAKEQDTAKVMNYMERYLLCMGYHTIQIDKAEYVKVCLEAGLIVLFCEDQVDELKDKYLEDKIFDLRKDRLKIDKLQPVLREIKEWMRKGISNG